MSKKNLIEAALLGCGLIALIYGFLYFYFIVVVTNVAVKEQEKHRSIAEYRFKPVPVVDTTDTFSDTVDSTWTDNYDITYVTFK